MKNLIAIALLSTLAASCRAGPGEIRAYVGEHDTLVLTNLALEGAPATVVVVAEPGLPGAAPPAPHAAPAPYRDEIDQAARAYRLDRALLDAVIAVESAYARDAVSPKGAVGLMQLMPATAQRFGVADPHDVLQNIRGGARYLRYLLDSFGGDLGLALAAYNAGEGAVRRHGGRIPPWRETIDYVRKVKGRYVQAGAAAAQ